MAKTTFEGAKAPKGPGLASAAAKAPTGGAIPPLTNPVAAGESVPLGLPPGSTAGAPAVVLTPEDRGASGDLSSRDVDAAIDGGIAAAVAGRRPLPTPEAEAAAAIAEAPIDPRPGSGRLSERAPFEGLSSAEIAALNAELALLPADAIEALRARLAQAPIDPVKGQGTLDDRASASADGVARTAGRFGEALLSLREGRAVTSTAQLDAGLAAREAIDGPALRVVALRDGHRRAGRAWSTTPAYVAKADLTLDQIGMLKFDPNLRVEDV